MFRFVSLFALGLIVLSARAGAQDKPPVENDFYRLISFDIPKEIMLEAGGIELLPGGSLAVCTRR
ncbi:MAG: hypothetical protein H7062_10425, partial [Candidatus Saccharimonas sp.]|nr:hypothetical protein [Planctomycetaceae bacterium]